MEGEIRCETRYILDISLDTTVAAPPPPPQNSGDRFFSVCATSVHVVSTRTGPTLSPSGFHRAFVPRHRFLSLGPEAVRTLFAPHLSLPTELTDHDVAGFARHVAQFAEAESREGGSAAVVAVRMKLTAVTILLLDDFELDLRESESGAVFRTVPASEFAVKALHDVVAVDKDDHEQGRCTICLEDLFAGDHCDYRDSTAAIMPCSHLFHRECIVQWLGKSHLCPLCRYPMPTSSLD